MSRVNNAATSTYAYVAYNAINNQIVVAFQGTNGMNYVDWLTNVDMDQVPFSNVPNVKVHSGFMDAYSSV